MAFFLKKGLSLRVLVHLSSSLAQDLGPQSSFSYHLANPLSGTLFSLWGEARGRPLLPLRNFSLLFLNLWTSCLELWQRLS